MGILSQVGAAGGVLLIAYLILAEFLDTIGRLEIVEKRWPRIWNALTNRPLRIALIIFLLVLVGKDLKDRSQEAFEMPPRIFPAPPAPIVQTAVIPPKPLSALAPQPVITPSKQSMKPLDDEPPSLVQIAQQRPVPSDNPDLPYGLEVVVTTSQDMSPTNLTISFSGEVGLMRGSIPAAVAQMASTGIVAKDKTRVVFAWASPAFTPRAPLTLRVFSDKRIKATKVAVGSSAFIRDKLLP